MRDHAAPKRGSGVAGTVRSDRPAAAGRDEARGRVKRTLAEALRLLLDRVIPAERRGEHPPNRAPGLRLLGPRDDPAAASRRRS